MSDHLECSLNPRRNHFESTVYTHSIQAVAMMNKSVINWAFIPVTCQHSNALIRWRNGGL